jgi:hypothetical protein
VKVLGKLFRGKFLAALNRAFQNGELDLGGSTAELSDPEAWRRFKDGLYNKDWIVYAKAPFGGPEHVFRYLGNYTHRIAISNHRIVNVADDKVTFRVKDYADGCKKKLMTLRAVEFLRRFLLHLLPNGFVRIRHYGLCASANVNGKLGTARRLLEPSTVSSSPPKSESTEPAQWWECFLEQTGIDVMACPACSAGRMARQRPLSATEIAQLAECVAVPKMDTS